MKVYCPYCHKEVDYKVKQRVIKEFKGIEVNSIENVGICNECKNDLYIDSLEEANLERLYETYRTKLEIINPFEIITFREKYALSQRELTSILGFGKMTINRYERGVLPTKSQSDYLKLLFHNELAFLQKAEEAYKAGNITARTYNKVLSIDLLGEKIKMTVQEALRKDIDHYFSREIDIYNGYREFDLELLENIISYIASKVKNLTITSLNKYLWFIDMLSFNQRAIGITGLTYQKQQYGPTIANFKYDEISRLIDKYERVENEDENGNLKVTIHSKNNFNLNDLKESEIKIIDQVIKLLKNKSVSDISELSHKEEGWIKTKKFDNISYEYALNLKLKN